MEFDYKDLDDSHCGFSLQIRAFLNFYESSYHELWVLFTTKKKKEKKRKRKSETWLEQFVYWDFSMNTFCWC